MTDSVWPIFIAAPFMLPSTATSLSAVSSSALACASSSRDSLARPVRAAWPAATPPRRAARPRRDWLTGLRAMGLLLVLGRASQQRDEMRPGDLPQSPLVAERQA